MLRVAGPYLTLMASLPWLPPLHAARQLPISRRRLERRLEMLEAEDAGLLHRIEAVVQWDRLGMHDSDAEIVRKAEALLPEIAVPALRDYLAWRLEVRTLVAALRRRAAGRPAPARGEAWGIGPATERIRRNWDDPDFGLGRSHPWLAEVRGLYAEGETLTLERRLMDLVWARTSRAAEGHEFDFPAVAFYLLRWHLLQRWTSYDRPSAERRFAALLDEALGRPAVHELAERLA
jgi:DNA-binding Lrp family transcriptional regulator